MKREEAIERLEFHKKVWQMVGGIDLCEVLDMAIAALREQGGSFQNGNDHNTVKDWPSYMDLPREQETVTNRNGLTNADHIRSMTDEELAKFSAHQMSRRDCWGCTWFWPCDYEKETCTKFFLDWLKQPYGGDT